MVNGKIVRPEGASGRVWTGTLEVGRPTRVEIRRRGFRPFETTLTPQADQPVELVAEIRPHEFPVQITADPRGTLVLLEGREVGRTPLNLRVPTGTRELLLKKSCYEEERVPLRLPDEPSGTITVNRRLARIRGC